MRYLALAVALLYSSAAAAQSLEAGVHVPIARWSEFEGNDVGIGGRLTWKVSSLVGVDAELAWYPSGFPPDTLAFSGNRFAGLLGITAGPRIDRVRPFGKVAAGFVRSSEAPEPFACIAIFPPPLTCLMAAGHVLPAIEIGGGAQLDVTARAFARVDVSGRWLKYPGPSFTAFPAGREEEFWGSALRVALGAGVKF